MSNWLDLSSTSNRHIRTYVQGFLDISGGDLIVRNNKLIVAGGDSSLNGRLLVSGNVVVGSTLYPTGGINLQNNLTMGGLINQSGTTMAGGIIYQPLLPEDVSAVIYSSRLYYNNMSGNSTTFTIGNVSSSVVIGLSGNPLTVSGPLYTIYDTSINNRLFVGEDASLNSRLFVLGDASLNSRLFVGSDASLNSRLFVRGDTSLNSKLFVGSDASLNGNVYLGKDLLVNGNLNVKQYTTNLTVYTVSYEFIVTRDLSLNGRLILSGDASMNQRLFVGGNITTNEKLTTGNGLSVSAGTITLPNNSIADAALSTNNALLSSAQTFSGVKTFSAAPVISSITNTGTITLPTSTDTLVGRATTDTLTNKTITTSGLLTATAGLRLSGDASMNKRLFVGGDINTNGKVGIGITSPFFLVDASGDIGRSISAINGGGVHDTFMQGKTFFTGLKGVTDTNADGYVGMQCIIDTNTNLGFGIASNQSAIAFKCYGNSTRASPSAWGGTGEAMRIQSNGNVGISTTTPAYTLDVAGKINTSSGYNLSYTSLPTFTSNMIGYKYSGSFISTTFAGWTKICNDITVTYQGVYIVTFTMRNGAYSPWGLSIGTTNSGDNNQLQTSFNSAYGCLSGVFTLTTNRTVSVYANQVTGTGNIDTNHIEFSLTRIA